MRYLWVGLAALVTPDGWLLLKPQRPLSSSEERHLQAGSGWTSMRSPAGCYASIVVYAVVCCSRHLRERRQLA